MHFNEVGIDEFDFLRFKKSSIKSGFSGAVWTRQENQIRMMHWILLILVKQPDLLRLSHI